MKSLNSFDSKYSYPTELGKMEVVVSDKGLVSLSFARGEKAVNGDDCVETKIHKEIFKQLSEYFDGSRKKFDIPLDLRGTDFQKKVWTYLYQIPYGNTVSYKDVAEAVGSPKGYRAVGMANNKNPIAVVCACHRVIGSDGKLVGYAYGLDMKEKLLSLEQKNNR